MSAMVELLVRGMWGLGDNIYQRPVLRVLAQRAQIYLDTPWPELYSDLPIKFVRGERALRTQAKNIRRQPPSTWSDPPRVIRKIRVAYTGADLARGSIMSAIERSCGVRADPFVFDLPDFGPPPISSDRPIAVVRPVTVRREWRNEARNPRPEYVARIAELLMSTHHVISVADVSDGEEWVAPPIPPCHTAFIRGELTVDRLLALVRSADVIAGGVGWIVPAAIALGRRAVIILGGHGGHNAPGIIIDRRMNADAMAFIVPDRYCQCSDMRHSCDKRISNLDQQFHSAATKIGLCTT